jgi:predicted small lipoprotein YifL
LGTRIFAARRQNYAAAFLRLRFPRPIARLPIQEFGAGIEAFRIGRGVPLPRKVGPRQRDPCSRLHRRADRVGSLFRTSERFERLLQLAFGGESTGELALHLEPLGRRTRAIIQTQRFFQRACGGRVISAPQLELAETLEGRGGFRPFFARPPRRQCIPVERRGAPEISGQTRESREIDEVRRRCIVTAVLAIERQCRREMLLRRVEITELFCQQPEIVVVGRHASRIADALTQRERLAILHTRAREIAAISAHAGQHAQRVAGHANVPDRRRDRVRAFEIDGRTVQPSVFQEGRSHVAHHRRDTRGVADQPSTSQRTSPSDDCGCRTIAAKHDVPRASHAVDPHLAGTLARSPRREPLYFPDEERVAPSCRVRRGDFTGDGQLLVARHDRMCGDSVPQCVGHCIANRQGSRTYFKHEGRLGEALRQQAKRIGGG